MPKIDPKKATPEQIQRAFELLEKEEIRKEKIRKGELKGASYKKRSEMTPEELKKVKHQDRIAQARNALLLRKAREAGITVSQKEIEDYCVGKWGKDY